MQRKKKSLRRKRMQRKKNSLKILRENEREKNRMNEKSNAHNKEI